MRGLSLAAALAVMLSPAAALPQEPTPYTSTVMSAMTSGFIETFSLRNLFELESARLAATRATSPDLRKVAQVLAQDHEQAAAELKRIAEKHRLAMPEDELNLRHQVALEALRQTDDASFDRIFIDLQLAAYDETTALVERYIRKGDNGALKRFARELLPVLRRHTELLRQIP